MSSMGGNKITFEGDLETHRAAEQNRAAEDAACLLLQTKLMLNEPAFQPVASAQAPKTSPLYEACLKTNELLQQLRHGQVCVRITPVKEHAPLLTIGTSDTCEHELSALASEFLLSVQAHYLKAALRQVEDYQRAILT
jgi:hypothetical protein